MAELDPLVKALSELCAREGGHAFVADKAKISADNLWQILNGTKLPSGNPRGVGPGTRLRISKAFPDWLDAKRTMLPSLPTTNPLVERRISSQSTQSPSIEVCIGVLAQHLSSIDPVDRSIAKAYLAGLCDAPDRVDLRKRICTALEPPTSHQVTPETGAKRTA